MLTSDLRMWVSAGTWSAATLAAVGITVAAGASWATTAAVLLLCAVPPVVLLLIGAAEPAPTVAEILHRAEAGRTDR